LIYAKTNNPIIGASLLPIPLSYRIHRLAFNKEMKKRKITDKFILTVIFGVEFAWVIIGTAWLLSNHDEKDMKTKHILDKRLSDYEVGRVAQKQLGTDIFIEHHACDLSSGTSNYFMWVTVGLMSGGYVIVIFFSFLNKSIPTGERGEEPTDEFRYP